MSKIRIEYVRLRPGGDEGEMDVNVIARVAAEAVEVAVTPAFGFLAQVPALAPDRNFNGGVVARITALQGAAVISTSTLANGVIVGADQGAVCLPVKEGMTISGVSKGQGYAMAANANLVAGVATAPVTDMPGATYILTVTAATWAGATLTLQELGPDGATWLNSIDQAGSPVAFTQNGRKGVVVGEGAWMRLLPTGGAPLAVHAVLG